MHLKLICRTHAHMQCASYKRHHDCACCLSNYRCLSNACFRAFGCVRVACVRLLCAMFVSAWPTLLQRRMSYAHIIHYVMDSCHYVLDVILCVVCDICIWYIIYNLYEYNLGAIVSAFCFFFIFFFKSTNSLVVPLLVGVFIAPHVNYLADIF